MTLSKKVIFFGTESFSLPSLQALIDNHYDIVAVVTKPDSARGRSKQLIEPAVKQLAKKFNLEVLQPNKLSDIDNQLSKLGADIGVLVSYGKILPSQTLNLFGKIGIVNIHPSLLPKYRGSSPIEAAIINGDKTTGVTTMKLVKAMDAGPIYDQVELALDGSETNLKLYDQTAKLGAERLTACLPDILSRRLEAKPQPKVGVSITTLLSKDMAQVDPLTDDAYAIERHTRAYLGFPRTKLMVKKSVVILTCVKAVDQDTGEGLIVECANKTYLRIDELIAPSGKTMSGRAYLLGRQK